MNKKVGFEIYGEAIKMLKKKISKKKFKFLYKIITKIYYEKHCYNCEVEL